MQNAVSLSLSLWPGMWPQGWYPAPLQHPQQLQPQLPPPPASLQISARDPRGCGLRLSTLEITFTPNLSAHHSGSAVALLLIVPSSIPAGMGNRPRLIHDSRRWNALLPSALQRPSWLGLRLSYLPKPNFWGETEVWLLCFTRRWVKSCQKLF